MIKKIEPQTLKHVAGGFATGITIVTIEDDKAEMYGMTANSFLSVSLDPPLVLFSVQNDASFLKHCASKKKVGISILSQNQKAISDQFAGLNKEDIEVSFVSKNKCHTLKNCLAWYETIIVQIIPAGDHQLMLCEVLDLGRDEKAKPLLYYSGYNKLSL